MNDTPVLEIMLTTHAYGGEAMGRLPDGRAIFVPFALPGERVRVKLVEEKRSFARGELLEVIQPAPERIAPRCPHFGECGGCHYQHLSYEDQLQVKTQILKDQLARIGNLAQAPVEPPIPAPQPFYYRNHIQFHLTPEGTLGFEASRTNQVVPIRECHLPDPRLEEIWRSLQIEPLPGLERVGLRVGAEDEIQLILESSAPEPLEFSVEELPVSAVHLGPGGCLVLAGSEAIRFEILGRNFQVSAGSFFQVNTRQAEAMVQHLLEILPLEGHPTILDAYCGVGLFSAFLAEKAGRLVGIESSPYACQDFAVNLDEFDNVTLYEASAEVVLSSMDFHPNIIVVDPPRAGLGKAALDGLLAQQAPWLAYVSCDPATLSRDARRLVASGYQLLRITPFDLFPQTYHIESISLWRRT